jgi:hypothetical protein
MKDDFGSDAEVTARAVTLAREFKGRYPANITPAMQDLRNALLNRSGGVARLSVVRDEHRLNNIFQAALDALRE